MLVFEVWALVWYMAHDRYVTIPAEGSMLRAQGSDHRFEEPRRLPADIYYADPCGYGYLSSSPASMTIEALA